jgi:hypothetical protein
MYKGFATEAISAGGRLINDLLPAECGGSKSRPRTAAFARRCTRAAALLQHAARQQLYLPGSCQDRHMACYVRSRMMQFTRHPCLPKSFDPLLSSSR